MKTKTFLLLITLLPAFVNAQWVQTNLPQITSSKNALADKIVEFNNSIYAGSFYYGLFRSTDNGNTWIQVRKDLFKQIGTMAVVGNRLYVNAIMLGVYSTDFDGNNWEKLDVPFLGSSNYVDNIFENNGYLIVHNSLVGFLRMGSENKWEKINSGLYPNGGLYIYTKIKSVMGKILAQATTSLYQTSNIGSSWELMSSTPTKDQINSFTTNGEDVFVGTSYGWFSTSYDSIGVYVYSNSSKQWKRLNGGGKTWSEVNDISAFDNCLFVATANSLQKSTDGGQTWEKVTNGIPENQNIHSIDRINGNIYVLLYDSRLFRSSDKGNTWLNISSNLVYEKADYIHDIAGTDTNLFLHHGGSVGVFSTSNNCKDWSKADLDISSIKAYISEEQTSFFKIFGPYISYDKGLNWIKIETPGGGMPRPFLWTNDITLSDTTLIAATNLGVMVCGYHNPNIMIAANSKGWTTTFTEAIGNCFVEKNKIAFMGTDKGIYTSSDYGNTWELFALTGQNVKWLFLINNKIYAFTKEKVFISALSELSWSEKNLAIQNLQKVVYSQNKFYAYVGDNNTWGNVLENSVDNITSIELEAFSFPTTYSLAQNYPNPFNPETTIEYQLSTPGFVTLKVYDLLGREVLTLVDENKQAGNHNCKLRIENGELSSGIYFYRLQSGSYSETKKLILVK
ncbi:MAG: T9SS type A sorting domain-containing protein [Parachlamydiaceae bacterium]|nr:T9SS type A sorting domain-containing protein [Parachlamydiaceae bacterium]